MLTRPVTSDALAQLRDERDLADRQYNDALTALDRSLRAPASLSGAPRAYDDHHVGTLNERWQILSGVSLPAPRGIRSRLAHFVWRLVAPVFERQQTFNSSLVDHLNRNVAAGRDADAAERGFLDALNAQAAALTAFQAHLIQYLQQVTLYVDTKDRLAAGSLMAVYDAAINALTDASMRRAESLQARQTRVEGRVQGLAERMDAADEELRSMLGTVQQAAFVLKREMERLLASATSGVDATTITTAPPDSVATGLLDSYKYVGFEDRFRGSQAEIRDRLKSYIELFSDATDVLDVGCGRGELLDLFREAGIAARGLDVNHEMVEQCRARGLDASENDFLRYLESLPDGALGGLVAVQVVEHLEPSYLMRSLEVAYHKLRPGARIVLETINPACWAAFFASYIRDLSHVRPIHPDTLRYLLTASGFGRTRIDFRSPYPEAGKLLKLPFAQEGDAPRLADLIEAFNKNVDLLNGLLFTYQDYAAIGERL
jgi:SAM-dependent methyltransferase